MGGQKRACLVGGVTEPVRHRRPAWWCDRDRDDDRAHRSSSDCRFAVGGHTTQRSVGGGLHGPSRQLEPAYATKPPKGPRRRAKGSCEGIQRHCCTQPCQLLYRRITGHLSRSISAPIPIPAGPRNVVGPTGHQSPWWVGAAYSRRRIGVRSLPAI